MPVAFTADLAAMLDRDLRALRRELEAYPEERQIWQPVPGLSNTGGYPRAASGGESPALRRRAMGWDGVRAGPGRGVRAARCAVRRVDRGDRAGQGGGRSGARRRRCGGARRATTPSSSVDAGFEPGISWCTLPCTSPTTWARSTLTAGWSRGTAKASGRSSRPSSGARGRIERSVGGGPQQVVIPAREQLESLPDRMRRS